MSNYLAPPAHVAPYVEVLGQDLAVDFLLAFGGAELYLPKAPAGRSRVEALIGKENTIALNARAAELSARVPTAKRWIARALKSQGLSTAEIARRLHTTDKTVRIYLKHDTDPRQFSLF